MKGTPRMLLRWQLIERELNMEAVSAESPFHFHNRLYLIIMLAHGLHPSILLARIFNTIMLQRGALC